MVGLLRLCCAAGACVLAAGLLMGVGGAVAAADPDSSVSAAQTDDATNASAEQHSTGARVSRSSSLRRHLHNGWLAYSGRPIRPAAFHRAPRKPKDEPSGTDTQDETKDDSDLGAAVLDPVAAVPTTSRPALMRWRRFLILSPRFRTRSRRFLIRWRRRWSAFCGGGAGSECGRASFQCRRVGSGHAQLGCRCGRAADATALRPVFLLVGRRRGAACSGRSGSRRRPRVVGSRGCIGGVAIAAGPVTCRYLGGATCRCLGPTGDRRDNRGNARRECARSRVSGVQDGTASARCRDPDPCRVVFPACSRRNRAIRFTVGAGRCCVARRRRAWSHYPGRGARGIPPGQSRCGSTHNGHRALRPSGAPRYRPIGVIGCRPSESIARRPSRGVNRRSSAR